MGHQSSSPSPISSQDRDLYDAWAMVQQHPHHLGYLYQLYLSSRRKYGLPVTGRWWVNWKFLVLYVVLQIANMCACTSSRSIEIAGSAVLDSSPSVRGILCLMRMSNASASLPGNGSIALGLAVMVASGVKSVPGEAKDSIFSRYSEIMFTVVLSRGY